MKEYDRFFETVEELKSSFKSLEKVAIFSEIDALERRAVAILKLLQVQIVGIGDNFYKVAQAKRNELRGNPVTATARVKELLKEEEPTPTEDVAKTVKRKTTTKAKKSE